MLLRGHPAADTTYHDEGRTRRTREGLPAVCRGTEDRSDPEARPALSSEEAELPVSEGRGERSGRSADG